MSEPTWSSDPPESEADAQPTRSESAAQQRMDRRRLVGAAALGLLGVGGAGAVGYDLFADDTSRRRPPGVTDTGQDQASKTTDAPVSERAQPSPTTSVEGITEKPTAKPSAPTSAPTSDEPVAEPAPDRRDVSIAEQPKAAGGPANRDDSLTRTGGGVKLPPARQHTGFAEAAKAATPVDVSPFVLADAQEHLLRRATFGARPDDRAALNAMGIDAWLSAQLSPDSIDDSRAAGAVKVFGLATASPQEVLNRSEKFSHDSMNDAAMATLARQMFSDRQVFEITVDTMANHLNVPLPSDVWDTGADYHATVIRQHAFGRFEDMLLAAMSHPAMLTYLNNNESRKESVNENLGRELLELHTVGVDGGYSESDVRNSAYILTGRATESEPGRFTYRADYHKTGAVQVMGFSAANGSPEGGMKVGDTYLRYLANHEATARAVCTKLAIRFVIDSPPTDLIDRLSSIYLSSGTDLREVVRGIFLSTDFWNAVGVRSRRPLEDAVGAARVLDVKPGNPSGTAEAVRGIYYGLRENGHAPLGWQPPNGYPDVSAAWLGVGDLISRWNMHRALVGGWREGLTYTPSDQLVSPREGSSARGWVNALAVNLVGQEMRPEHTAALLGFAGVRGSDPADRAQQQSDHLAALILDSGYFQLR